MYIYTFHLRAHLGRGREGERGEGRGRKGKGGGGGKECLQLINIMNAIYAPIRICGHKLPHS